MLPGPWHLYAAAGLALASAYAGWTVRDWQCDAAVARAIRKADAASAKAISERDAVASAYEIFKDQAYAGQYQASSSLREIYRDVPISGDCAAPADVVRLLNSRIDVANAARSGKSGVGMPRTK